MKLNVVSDLHLSKAPLAAPVNDADVAVVAGDIARPEAAIEWARQLGKPVLYVPGNHEFYGGTLTGTVERLRQLARGTCVQVLHDDRAVVGGVRFLGSTLWTDFLLFGDGAGREAAVTQALAWMHDFRRIHLDEQRERLFSPLEAAALFARHAAWLAHELHQPFDGPTVVITHHAPSARSVEARFRDSPLSAGFASNADHLLDGERAVLWVHGHMHHSVDYRLNGVRVVCNPRGYVKEGQAENPAFDPDFIVEV